MKASTPVMPFSLFYSVFMFVFFILSPSDSRRFWNMCPISFRDCAFWMMFAEPPFCVTASKELAFGIVPMVSVWKARWAFSLPTTRFKMFREKLLVGGRAYSGLELGLAAASEKLASTIFDSMFASNCSEIL